MTKRLLGVAVVTGVLFAGAADVALAAKRLPGLSVRARFPGDTLIHHARLRLRLLDPADFRVIRHPSPSSLTLAYPATKVVRRNGRYRRVKAKPCALATFRLRLVPGADALGFVRGAVANPDEQGTVTYWAPGMLPGQTAQLRTRAWRVAGDIVESSRLVVDGVAATPFPDATPALRVLTVHARMVRTGGSCGGTNTFTVGPGVEATLGAA